MGGVAGHAGLFSTADDLARYCQMLLNGGIFDGKRILSANTIARMTAPYVVSETGATRGLGWDMNSSFSANRGDVFPLGSFGHTGFTGTSLWIDRVTETFVVFLSNRVHPDGKGDVTPLRSKVATVLLRQSKTFRLKKSEKRKMLILRKLPRKLRDLSVNSQQSTVNSQSKTQRF
jgi:CubicO group peptidase (beta-lactamase class C family)